MMKVKAGLHGRFPAMRFHSLTGTSSVEVMGGSKISCFCVSLSLPAQIPFSGSFASPTQRPYSANMLMDFQYSQAG